MNSRDKALLNQIWGIRRFKLPASLRNELPQLEERLRELARQGDPVAMTSLAYLLTGKPGGRATPEVRRLIRKAAKLGEPSAQLHLASMLQRDGELRDAQEWLERSARQGLAESVFKLGISLVGGDLGRKDVRKGIRLLIKADSLGHSEAAGWLGWAFDTMKPPDPKSAVSWYRKAARNGDPIAMHNLAVAYGSGQGVRQNRRSASRWYALETQARLRLRPRRGRPSSRTNNGRAERRGAVGAAERRKKTKPPRHQAVECGGAGNRKKIRVTETPSRTRRYPLSL